MIGRLVILATAAMLAWAPAAAARPVAGGGSFNDAPLLTPGAYTDTIRLDETLFYAVRLAPGQRLAASADLQATAPGLSQGNELNTGLEVTGPLRIPAGSAGSGADQGYPPTTLSARAHGPVAQPPGAEGETSSGQDYSGAGTWYVEVNLEQFTGAKQRAELPLRVDLAVSGTPTSGAGSPGVATSPGTATPGGRPPATTTAPPRRRPAHPHATGGGSGHTTGVGTGTLVLAGAVGLLAGALLGTLTAVARRRPAAPPA